VPAAIAAQVLACSAQTVHYESAQPITTAAKLAEPAADPEPAPPRDRATAQPELLDAFAFGGLNLSGDLRALHAGRPVQFLLQGAEPLRLSRQIARVHPELTRTTTGVVIEAGKLTDDVLARHRRPSFVIDSDNPIFGPLSETLRGDDTPSAVCKCVAAYFRTPAHGEFWRASDAATKRAGDCTEHAVVAAAVARRLGRPSRVVLGYALLSDGQRGIAVGHAWTEIHDGQRWQRVDATPLGAEAAAYLVMGELSDEGPGYERSLARLWAMLNVSGIEVLSSSAPRSR
jgi:hypothetical protein